MMTRLIFRAVFALVLDPLVSRLSREIDILSDRYFRSGHYERERFLRPRIQRFRRLRREIEIVRWT